MVHTIGGIEELDEEVDEDEVVAASSADVKARARSRLVRVQLAAQASALPV